MNKFVYLGSVVSYKLLQRCSNPLPNKPWFLRVCSTGPLKTLWEKEKLLVMSNFSFSHSVFCLFGELSVLFIKSKIVVCKLFQFGKILNLLFGKGLSHISPEHDSYIMACHDVSDSQDREFINFPRLYIYGIEKKSPVRYFIYNRFSLKWKKVKCKR